MPKGSIKYLVLSIKGFFIFLVISLILNTYLLSHVQAKVDLYSVNQRVCDRFEEDTARLAAIMDEYRDRNGITETRVAFGGVDTSVKAADYQITYAAEAIAYQRAQNYSNVGSLKYSLQVLAGKVLKAKGEVGKVID